MSSGFHVDTAVSSNHPKEVRIEAFKPAMGGGLQIGLEWVSKTIRGQMGFNKNNNKQEYVKGIEKKAIINVQIVFAKNLRI